jgi:hypothetical protein
MTCREIDSVLISCSTTKKLAPEAAEHISYCEKCWRLVRVLNEARTVAPLPADRRKRISSAMLRDLKPVRPLAPSRIFILGFALVFLGAVAVGSFLSGSSGWSVLSTFQKAAVFGPLAACAGMLAWSLVCLMVPGSKHVIRPIWSSIAALTLLVIVIAGVFHPQAESKFVSTGLRCLRTGSASAVPAAALFWLLLRRGAVLSPGLTGATAGGLAGLAGLMVLEVRCPNLSSYHILVWHWGVALLAMLGGLALGHLLKPPSVTRSGASRSNK